MAHGVMSWALSTPRLPEASAALGYRVCRLYLTLQQQSVNKDLLQTKILNRLT